MNMEIEDKIFNKKKRELTDKQKEALAKGREKAKAKRLEKLKEEAEIKAAKEQKAVIKSTAKKTRSEQARARVQGTSRRKKVEDFHNKKYEILENLDSEKDFDELEKALDIDEDIISDRTKLKKYLGDMIVANGGRHPGLPPPP
jgi:hypothetical protein